MGSRLRPRACQGLGVEVLVPGHRIPDPGHASPGHTQPHQHLTNTVPNSLILPQCALIMWIVLFQWKMWKCKFVVRDKAYAMEINKTSIEKKKKKKGFKKKKKKKKKK